MRLTAAEFLHFWLYNVTGIGATINYLRLFPPSSKMCKDSRRASPGVSVVIRSALVGEGRRGRPTLPKAKAA
jgi:hypothetical protein